MFFQCVEYKSRAKLLDGRNIVQRVFACTAKEIEESLGVSFEEDDTVVKDGHTFVLYCFGRGEVFHC